MVVLVVMALTTAYSAKLAITYKQTGLVFYVNLNLLLVMFVLSAGVLYVKLIIFIIAHL